MTTRIYQGRIVSAEFENPKYADKLDAISALVQTYEVFQDAVNYHLVALAGMAVDGNQTIGMRFRQQLCKIWTEHPRGKEEAKTLQQSLVQTLNMRSDSTFEEVVDAIYETCENRDVLPYVQQLILDRTQKGDGAIQQEGRSLLPKLCDVAFKGNFDYSSKEKKASEGKLRLIKELNREDITPEELEALANEMDLSWAGIKTQPNAERTGAIYYTQEETIEQVKNTVEQLCDTVQKGADAAWEKYSEENSLHLYEDVRNAITARGIINSGHLLAKNNKTAASLKQAAVFFMYYPCNISAQLLRIKLGKIKPAKVEVGMYDCASLDDDPILLARGSKGYVYRGFTALPTWNQEGALMYSSEWDILAFKEALKTLHAYDLKMQERNEIVCNLQKTLDYMLKGQGAAPVLSEDDERVVPVLCGDPRYELLLELVKEISPDAEAAYTISHRALNAYDEVRSQWLLAEQQGADDEETLKCIVRKVQGSSARFGAGVLFEAMCREKYRLIWHDCPQEYAKVYPRSSDILRDFGKVQELEDAIIQYSRPIKITAAEPVYSPRQLLFSDLGSFGNKCSGHEYVKGQAGMIKLRVIVKNEKGYLEGATVIAKYSAPRIERDELGLDAGKWISVKKGETASVAWLQPMMKALGVDKMLLPLGKEPAVALQVKTGKNRKDEKVCMLNFPVTLDLTPLHKYVGKAELWKNQMLGVASEKLHLHWAETYAGKEMPWWQKSEIQQNGYDVLSIDLGVRYAAAWALTHVQKDATLITNRGTELHGRYIGSADTTKWYGFSRKQGIIKIDGEGNIGRHYESLQSDSLVQQPDGITVASKDDLLIAASILRRVGKDVSEAASQNVLVLGNDAISAMNRLLSRCRRYQSILVKLKDSEKQEVGLLEAKEYFDYNEVTRRLIPGIIQRIDSCDVTGVCDLLLCALLELRAELPAIATELTNLLLPRKNGCWKWVESSKPGYVCAGQMKLVDDENTPQRHIYHRGGLAVKRLTQLEKLRQTLQSMNRILWMTPGEPTPFGKALREIPVEDPCPDLLRKIENVREQRVNKIAHEIVAQALGVRLKKSRIDKNADGRDVVHGEYEKIPGRTCVDFVVLENLSAYLTSIDKSPDENSTLMRWSHRQLVMKVKQLLEEVFGIPVLCTHAAYTSKFDSYTSSPGFRARELDKAYIERLAKSDDETEQHLGGVYARIWDAIPLHLKRKGLKLIAPDARNGGEFFVSADGERVTNADMNAAVNIGWRGIAAPDAFDLLHRVRLTKKKNDIKPIEGNKREKALKGAYSFHLYRMPEGIENTATAFWVHKDFSEVPPFAAYEASDNRVASLVYGRDLWSYMKNKQYRWQLCNRYNLKVLARHVKEASLLKDYIEGRVDDNDNIPL